MSLLGYEVVSYQSDELMNLWNPKLPNWRTDKTNTAQVYKIETGEQADRRVNNRQTPAECRCPKQTIKHPPKQNDKHPPKQNDLPTTATQQQKKVTIQQRSV